MDAQAAQKERRKKKKKKEKKKKKMKIEKKNPKAHTLYRAVALCQS